MFAVEVRDHIMIAHSLPGAVFGPAQTLHGATLVVDVAFFRKELDPDNIVVDIGRAAEALRAVLRPMHYANLDEHPPFAGKGATTTEFLSHHVFEELRMAIRRGELGPHAVRLTKLRVTIRESPAARTWFEGELA